jgi:hypothetical protein
MADNLELVNRVELAESDRSLRPGQLVAVDNEGRVMTRRDRFRAYAKLTGIGAAIVAAPFVAFGATGVWFACVTVPVLLGVVLTLRRMQPYVLAQSRIVAGDLDGAESILASTPERRHVKLFVTMRARLQGFIALGRGNHREAIEHLERALVTSRVRIQTFSVSLTLAIACAELGDVERAREIRAALKAPDKMASILAIALAEVDVTIALATGTDATLDDTTLETWTRLALELDHTNMMLAKLARVLAGRGDDDLAEHLAREASERFGWRRLVSWPTLDAWIRERLQQPEPGGGSSA